LYFRIKSKLKHEAGKKNRIVFGTRPEAIKKRQLVREFQIEFKNIKIPNDKVVIDLYVILVNNNFFN
jgi:hypothetical protein